MTARVLLVEDSPMINGALKALLESGGFDVALFNERTGLPLNAVLRELNEAERRGLISRDQQRIAPTALGRRFLNDLLQIFLRDAGASTHPQ